LPDFGIADHLVPEVPTQVVHFELEFTISEEKGVEIGKELLKN